MILLKTSRMEVIKCFLNLKQNYKSFVEEASFSMVAAPKQKGLDIVL